MPVKCWYGSGADLDRLIEQAIKDGRPLRSDVLYAIQGVAAPDPDVVT